MNIKSFVMRQFARFRFFISKIASFFSMFNFITLLLILLTGMGISLAWYWIIIAYVGVTVLGLILVFITEKLGLWNIDFIQTWKMDRRNFFLQTNKYSAINIELMSRKTEEELEQMKNEIEEGWK